MNRCEGYAVGVRALVLATSLGFPWASRLVVAFCDAAEFLCPERAEVEPHAPGILVPDSLLIVLALTLLAVSSLYSRYRSEIRSRL